MVLRHGKRGELAGDRRRRHGKLYAIKPDGTLTWSYATGSHVLGSSPAIGADGTVYVGSFDYKLNAIGP